MNENVERESSQEYPQVLTDPLVEQVTRSFQLLLKCWLKM